MGLITPSCKKQVITETSTIETETGDRADAGQPQDGSVTVASESRKEADSPTADTLKPNKRSRVGTWNVRTLHQTGKLSQVVREFDNYKLDLLGLSETRWTGSDKKSHQSGDTFIYSGRGDNIHWPFVK